MAAKLFIFLAVIGAIIVSHHQSNVHAVSIDDVKDKGVGAITAVKLASDKITSAATIPLGLIKKKALLAVKVPIILAKKKLAIGLALKKAKIIAPILLFKAAKKAIQAKIVQKKLKLKALKAILIKHIALAKLLKLAKIPLLLAKLKLPIITVKKAIKAHQKKQQIASASLGHAAKLEALKKLVGKGALTNKLASKPLPIPGIEKGTDLGLGALLSGALPFLGSAVNNVKEHEIPNVVYQFVPDYATQFKKVQIIPKQIVSVNDDAGTEIVYEAPKPSSSSSSSNESLEPSPELNEENSSVYGLPSDQLILPKL